MVAFNIKPTRLQLLRMERTRYLNDVDLGDYTDLNQVKSEVSYGLRLFREYGCSVVDVTYKSIEETATDVMRIIYAQTGRKKGKVY